MRVLTDWADLETLRAPWDELTAASGASPFVSHRWLSLWSKAFGESFAPRIIQVWRDGQLVGAAPLGLTSHRIRHLPFGVSVRCLAALSNHETPLSQWLFAPGHEDALDKMLEATADNSIGCDMCKLEPLPDDATTGKLRERASRLGFPLTWCATASSVTVDVSNGWEAYLAARSKNFRKKIRRERRALEGAEHRWLRGRSDGSAVLERAFAVSVESWKGRAGTAIGSTDDQRAFYRALWDGLGPEGAMEVNLLEIEGKEAGSLVAIRHGDIAYGVKVDFVEDFGGYSPGRMMVADFVERCADDGLREVDMLRRSRFTEEFSEEGYVLGRLQLFPRWNLPALWYNLEERLRPIGRGWRHERRRGQRRRGAHVQKGDDASNEARS